jgi:hypothetical protein
VNLPWHPTTCPRAKRHLQTSPTQPSGRFRTPVITIGTLPNRRPRGYPHGPTYGRQIRPLYRGWPSPPPQQTDRLYPYCSPTVLSSGPRLQYGGNSDFSDFILTPADQMANAVIESVNNRSRLNVLTHFVLCRDSGGYRPLQLSDSGNTY